MHSQAVLRAFRPFDAALGVAPSEPANQSTELSFSRLRCRFRQDFRVGHAMPHFPLKARVAAAACQWIRANPCTRVLAASPATPLLWAFTDSAALHVNFIRFSTL